MVERRARGEGSIFQRKDGLRQGAGYTPAGKQKRRTVYGRTQAEVREKLDDLERRAAAGTLSDGRVTVQELLERWPREKEEQVKPRTVEIYRGLAARHADELGGITTPAAFHHQWLELQAKAGVPRKRLHDLRHLHVNLLVRRGLGPRAVADRVGHSDPSSTLRRYSHRFEAQRKAAAVDLRDRPGSHTPPEERNREPIAARWL